MEIVKAAFIDNGGFIFTLVSCAVLLGIAHWFIMKREPAIGAEKKLPRQVWMFFLTIICLLVIILALPISDSTRGQVLSLMGIVLTAIIALSSTTFVANAMAGLMLRLIDTFRPGDYLKFNDQLCRVTERGLFHTEVQNEEKDLVTYPNLFLVTNPIHVIQQSGTLISCTLSLGYDVPREKVEKHLLAAAEAIALETPFVLVKTLGDFSIVYRVSGFLYEVKNLVTWRSNLSKSVIQGLHSAGIEIVSPNYMNSRQFESDTSFVPSVSSKTKAVNHTDESHDTKIFDKAEVASERELLSLERERLVLELAAETLEDNSELRTRLESELNDVENRINLLDSSQS